MKQLVRNTVLFLGGVAACLAVASAYFELRVRQNTDFFRQVEWFRNDDVQPEVLLVGDSRMAVNVDQQHLPPGFYNFSYPGETLRQIYLRVKFALETKPSIRYLVLGLEDVAFSDARARLRDATRQMLFSNLVDLTEVYPASPRFLLRHAVLHYVPLINASQRRRAWEAFYTDLRRMAVGRIEESKHQLVCGNMELTGEGEWANLGKPTRDRRAYREVAQLLGGSAGNPEMQRVLYKILVEARVRGVKVIGVRNPVSGSYLKATNAYYDVPVLEFLDQEEWLYAMLDYESLFAQQASLFYNVDHLNHDGARQYTRRLVEDLSRLVHVDASAAADHCGGTMEIEPRRWPYNDIVTEWLRTPACHNFKGDCGRRRSWVSRPGEEERDAADDGAGPGTQESRIELPPRSDEPRLVATLAGG